MGIGWWLIAEHPVKKIFVSGISITVVVDELRDELSYLVNALWDLVVDPTVTG